MLHQWSNGVWFGAGEVPARFERSPRQDPNNPCDEVLEIGPPADEQERHYHAAPAVESKQNAGKGGPWRHGCGCRPLSLLLCAIVVI